MPKCLTLLCNYGYTGILITCYEAEALCYQEEDIPDTLSSIKTIGHLAKDLIEAEPDHTVSGIMDHVDGYPKIYNFTVILK